MESNSVCLTRHCGTSRRRELMTDNCATDVWHPFSSSSENTRAALRYSVLLCHVATLGFDHELELVRLEQRIVAELEREVRRLLQLLRKIALLLEHVHRDIRVQL